MTKEHPVEIVSRKNAVGLSEKTGEQSSREYCTLVQNHLETLSEFASTRYDCHSKLVEPTNATASLGQHIREAMTDWYTPAENAGE